MHDCPIPCGNITYFEGDIKKLKYYFEGLNNNKPFGIFEFNISSVNRIQTNNNKKTLITGGFTHVYYCFY